MLISRVLLLVCSYSLSKMPSGKYGFPWREKIKETGTFAEGVFDCWTFCPCQEYGQAEVPWSGWCSYHSQCLAWCRSHSPPQSCPCPTGMAAHHRRRTSACQDWSLTPLKERKLICLPKLGRTHAVHPSLQKAVLTHSWRCCVGKNELLTHNTCSFS